MQQELNESGLSSLNWQNYYKNVQKGCNHSHPTFYVVCETTKEVMEIFDLAKENNSIAWVVDASKLPPEAFAMNAPLMNVRYLNRNLLSKRDWDEYWKNVDYIYCEQENLEILLPAMLSGVERLDTKEEIFEKAKTFLTRELAVDRVNAFEKGKAKFDRLISNG